MFLSETGFDFKGKTVLVRIDCDVDIVAEGGKDEENGRWKVDEDFRLRTILPTIKFLQEKGVEKIILMGHMGRPGGVVVNELKLEPIGRQINKLLNTNFQFSITNFQSIFNLQNIYQIDTNIILLENLRFNEGEENPSVGGLGFAKELASLGDVYVNECFGVSHREHASLVGIPKLLPGFLGLRFEEEIKVLGGLRKKTERPLVFVLGGSKGDKVDYLEFLSQWCDKVIVGGKLPLLPNFKFQISNFKNNGKDIDDESIKKAVEIINTARTLVWAGPMGVYEEEENQKGTYEVAKAVAGSEAFKVAGGGDTHRVLSRLNLWDKFDFVSVGGGAMLYFLEKRTLPGIEAISNH